MIEKVDDLRYLVDIIYRLSRVLKSMMLLELLELSA